MADITNLFRRHHWSCEILEPGVWRASFATEREEEFDLYVLVAEDWVHFAVSPLVPRPAAARRAAPLGPAPPPQPGTPPGPFRAGR